MWRADDIAHFCSVQHVSTSKCSYQYSKHSIFSTQSHTRSVKWISWWWDFVLLQFNRALGHCFYSKTQVTKMPNTGNETENTVNSQCLIIVLSYYHRCKQSLFFIYRPVIAGINQHSIAKSWKKALLEKLQMHVHLRDLSTKPQGPLR